MSRAPIESRPSTAQWLIAAREAAGFTNATLFLAAVKEAEGKAPSYSTYAQWESGSVTPRRSSLRIVEHYHATHKTEAGNAPAPEPTPDLATALLALARELAEARREREEYRQRLHDLETTVAELAARNLPVAAPAARTTRAPRAVSAG